MSPFSSGLAAGEWCLRPSNRPKLVERCGRQRDKELRESKEGRKKKKSCQIFPSRGPSLFNPGSVHCISLHITADLRFCKNSSTTANKNRRIHVTLLTCTFLYFFFCLFISFFFSLYPPIFHKPKSHYNLSDPPVIPAAERQNNYINE